MDQLPETETSFAVILDDDQIPSRIYLVHNNADPIVNGKEGKPDGIGLPGGGREQDDKTPRHTARREVARETGFKAVLATYGADSRYGEIFCEPKPWIGNTVYSFHMRRVSGNGRIEESDETGRDMRATLGNILMMPLAVKKTRLPDGTVRVVKNPQGIYFSHRERLFRVLHAVGYDFCALIPNLSDLIRKVNGEEVGDYIYDMLIGALQAGGVANPLQRPTDEELAERYRPAIAPAADDPDEQYRRWFEGGAAKAAL